MANNIREIITKAVISKGKKRSINKYTFEVEGITKVLGCWICNHRYNATIKDNKSIVLGTYDLHIWYSMANGDNSTLLKTQISYLDEMDVVKKEQREFCQDDEIEATCNKFPKCIRVSLEGIKIIVEIEKEMAIRIIGDACIRVETKNEKESWDEIENIEINENFIT